MTERGRAALTRTPDTLAIGPSRLAWDGRTLTVHVDEVSAPIPQRVRGEVRFTPLPPIGAWMTLDAAGRHAWRPIAANARVEVDLEAPRLRWTGAAYLDANRGDEPLERGFTRWDWCRVGLGERSAVFYDVEPRNGAARGLSLLFDPAGGVTPIDPPPPVALPKTGWRVPRAMRSEGSARLRTTLLDAPFYARSVVETQLFGAPRMALHESLSLDRLANPLVRAMLPWRMPRRFW